MALTKFTSTRQEMIERTKGLSPVQIRNNNGQPCFYFKNFITYGANGQTPIVDHFEITVTDWSTYFEDFKETDITTIVTENGELKKFKNKKMAQLFIYANGGSFE